ncbi:hypothetical protein [Clostridium sp.]|nr:hypothetical protein [Clostridium sp.]MBK5235368.1 hypothetical protein [Clostridium sp.]
MKMVIVKLYQDVLFYSTIPLTYIVAHDGENERTNVLNLALIFKIGLYN